ncbi:MAG: hypothetical protein WD357_09145 [Gracilimonas sp.]
MPNHFHWLIHVNQNYKVLYEANERARKLNPLNKDIGSLLSSYTQAINKKQDRTGSLFRKRSKAKSLREDNLNSYNYGINCFFYIHQNPLKAGLVDKIEDWEFSSFQDYTGFRNGSLCDITLAKDLFKLPEDENEFYEVSQKIIPDQIIQKIL